MTRTAKPAKAVWQRRALLLASLSLFALGAALVLAACNQTPTPTTAPQATSTPPPSSASIEVPVTVRGASSLGSLQMEISFDSQVLSFKAVKAGTLARNAMVDSSSPSAGRVRIGLVTASGLSGDGDVVTLVFSSTGKAGPSSLTVEKVDASDTNLHDLVVSVAPGQFAGVGGQNSGPVLSFR